MRDWKSYKPDTHLTCVLNHYNYLRKQGFGRIISLVRSVSLIIRSI